MSLSIDDILFPGGRHRRESHHLGEQIRYIDQIIGLLSAPSHPLHTAETSSGTPNQPGVSGAATPRRDAVNEARGLTRFSIVSTREVIAYRVSEQIPSVWCAWDDNDTSGRGGWGSSADEAVLDLLEVLS